MGFAKNKTRGVFVLGFVGFCSKLFSQTYRVSVLGFVGLKFSPTLRICNAIKRRLDGCGGGQVFVLQFRFLM